MRKVWRNPKTFLYKKIGCPFCSSHSVLEEIVANLLSNKKITYFRQVTRKTFIWLENLRLDFYLPDYNIAIECQGEQHFVPVDFAGRGEEWAKKQLEENIKRDKHKEELCNENNIKLLYFSKEKFKGNYNIITDEEELLNKIYDKDERK